MIPNEADRLDELLRNGSQKRNHDGNTARVGAVHEPPLAALVAVARQVEALRQAVVPLPAGGTTSARKIFLAQAARMRSNMVARNQATMNAPSSAAKRPMHWFTRLHAWAKSRQAGASSRREGARLRPHPSTRLTRAYYGTGAGRASQGKRAFASVMVAQLPTMAAVALLFLFLSLTTGITMGSLGKAAQASLPGDRFYGYKIAQENLDAALTFDPFGRVALYVELVKQRSEEIFKLVQAGRTAPVETARRLQQHLVAAFLAASQLPDTQMESALLQIRQVSLSTQFTLEQAEWMAIDDPSRITLDVASYAALNASALAEQGLADPQEFRALMSALPPLPSATPSSVPLIITPPFNPTPVSVMPTATIESFNPPAFSPTPSETSGPAGATPVPATATGTPINPPPATPSPTNIAVGPTPTPATATVMPTPTATSTPGPPPFFTTPTPIVNSGGGN
ncbi:MAG: DUF5667 domain-containing protein [Anaerolineales bacterium]|nr:DUF5667 domain-containing protein [Anaerolineales bacterium]